MAGPGAHPDHEPDPGRGPGPGPDELAALLNEVIEVAEDVRHAEWITPPGPLHQAFDDAFAFLVDGVHALGWSAGPSADSVPGIAGRVMRNVAAETHGEPKAAAALLVGELRHVAEAVRRAGAALDRADPALRPALSDGLTEHIARLTALSA